MHWSPKVRAASRRNSGRRTASELTDTLSAPARSSMLTSSSVFTPPPTVNGMKISSDIRSMISTTRPREAALGTMSSTISSSTP